MKTFQNLALSCVLMLTLTNCQLPKRTDKQTLVTENHECFLKNYTHITTEVIPLYISIDIPVEGPQPLMDSLTDFINQTLYGFLDNGDDRHLPYENVYTKDTKHLLEHYQNAYEPFFLADSSNIHEFASDCLKLNLVALTNTYATFEIDRIFYGEGDEIAKNWVTFILADGHRLTKIINNENMLRFYKEHPKQRSNDFWENITLDVNESYLDCQIGLLSDSIVLQYSYAPGIFEDVKYPLEVISPYLFHEAKELTANNK